MELNSLLSAIPSSWNHYWRYRTIDDGERERGNSENVEKFRKCSSTSKIVYKCLNDHGFRANSHVQKWEGDLGCNISSKEFVSSFNNAIRATCIMKYRSFQYRLCHRAIITNVRLKHWKMIDCDLCTFCKEERETLVHLFVKCQSTKILWYEACKVYYEISKEVITLSDYEKIFGSSSGVLERVKNLIIIIVKQYIYRQRCLQMPLSNRELKSIIFNVQNVELYYAKKDGIVAKYYKKWYKESEINLNLLDQMSYGE